MRGVEVVEVEVGEDRVGSEEKSLWDGEVRSTAEGDSGWIHAGFRVVRPVRGRQLLSRSYGIFCRRCLFISGSYSSVTDQVLLRYQY